MISCILAFYIAAFALPGRAATASSLPTVQNGDPDALYAKREDLASAREAERLWQERLTARPQLQTTKMRQLVGGQDLELQRSALHPFR